jgi:hypothetical protein
VGLGPDRGRPRAGLTALGVLFQPKGVRWIGVAIAALNAIAQMFFISAYPLWSLAVFTLDVLVIYGLVVHGGAAAAPCRPT